MLESWLGPEYAAFRESRAARAPFAAASACRAEDVCFDWTVLERVLRSSGAPDVPLDLLVVQKNELLDRAPPRSADDVRALFARGIGIVVRRAERHDQALGELARAFAKELGGSAHIQLFVTPAATHGFGWHYDDEDVCILQTAGSKTYYFRANTQVQPEEDAPPDFTRIKHETSRLMTCTLAKGDLLYLPRRMWHVAKAVEDSFSISVGVR